MKLLRYLVPLVLAGGLFRPAVASDRPIVVVFNMETQRIKLSKSLLNSLSDYLATQLAGSGMYQVVPRDQLKERLLQQKKKSYKQCYDQKCQIELGRELAAEKTLASQVIKFGKFCTVNATLYDLKKAATESAASVKGKCNEEGLIESMDKVVDELTGAKQREAEEKARKAEEERKAREAELARKAEEERKAREEAERIEAEKKAAERKAAVEKYGEIKQPGSNLYWLRCSLGQKWTGFSCVGMEVQMFWDKAMEACPSGYRLPRQPEFVSLLDGCDKEVRAGLPGYCNRCADSSKCSAVFGTDEQQYQVEYWTSTSESLGGGTWGDIMGSANPEPWTVFLRNRGMTRRVKQDEAMAVRCVRDGP